MKIQRPPSKQYMPADAKLVFKGKVFDTYQWEQEMFDGTTMTFEKVKRPDTASVIPVTPEGKIIIIEQEQPGKKASLGFPGGRIEVGEDLIEGAKRELIEETGYVCDRFELLDSYQPHSNIEWAVYSLVAKDCIKSKELNPDSGEKITMNLIEFDELIDLVVNEEMPEEMELTVMALKAKMDPAKMADLRKKILG